MKGLILFLILLSPAVHARVPRAVGHPVRRLVRGRTKTAADLSVQAARDHGSRAVREGGLEALSRDPDALVRVAAELTPRARRELLQNPERLLPLALSRGPEAVELAVRHPGVHRKLMRMGSSAGQLSDVPSTDLPRLLRYLEAADSPATREALLNAYAREGPRLFERIPPRLVLAGGLSTALVLGTHRATAPLHEMGGVMAQTSPQDLLNRFGGRKPAFRPMIMGVALMLPLILIPALHYHKFYRRTSNEKEPVPVTPDAEYSDDHWM